MLHVIRFLTLLLITSAVNAAELDTRYLDELQELHQITVSESIKHRLEEIDRFRKSKEFLADIERHSQSLSAELDLPTERKDATESEDLARTHHPVMFISASMPNTLLRNYVAQMERFSGGTMVLRGTVGDPSRLMETLRFIEAILNKDPNCKGPSCDKRRTQVIIDPLLFTRFDVDRVPAFTLFEHISFEAHCQNPVEDLPDNGIVYGDASIEGLMIELARITTSAEIKKTVERLLTYAR